jgi:hypothetical protein
MMDALTLADPPASRVFTAIELAELREAVEVIDKNTTIFPVDLPRQLEIDDEGFLPEGYRFTTVAFRQLCQALVVGLNNLLGDVAGRRRRPGGEGSEYSAVTAIAIFNRLLRLRFGRILGRQLVRNTVAKTIDGLVGPKFRYLSNMDFLDKIIEDVDESVKFHRGYLYGRHLATRFIHKDRIVINRGSVTHVFAPGQHFANSEIGNASVRAAPMLSLANGSAALGPWYMRLPHQGRDFNRNLAKLCGSLAQSVPSKPVFETWLSSLDQQFLIKGEPNGEALLQARASLTQRLTERKLTQQLAQRAVAVAFFGANLAAINGIEEFAGNALVLGERTAYDILIALMDLPIKMPLALRERIEQLAYSVLSGRFPI